MMILKVPQRKSLRLEKGDVICTRLILPAVFPAAIKTRNSEGFCEDNLLLQMSEQNSQGGARPTMLTIPIHISPVQADNSYLLTKINGGRCSNTHPGSHKTMHTIPTIITTGRAGGLHQPPQGIFLAEPKGPSKDLPTAFLSRAAPKGAYFHLPSFTGSPVNGSTYSFIDIWSSA